MEQKIYVGLVGVSVDIWAIKTDSGFWGQKRLFKFKKCWEQFLKNVEEKAIILCLIFSEAVRQLYGGQEKWAQNFFNWNNKSYQLIWK